MRNRIVGCVFAIVLFAMSILQVSASGIYGNEEADVIYLDNGDYIAITIEEYDCRSTQTKSGNKKYSYTDSSGSVLWVITLNGTFTYTGTSATCTSSSVNVTINDSNWYTVSKTAGKTGNTAIADVTMGKKLLGITISKKDYHLTLTCSASGTLS